MLMPAGPLPSVRDTQLASKWHPICQSQAVPEFRCFMASQQMPSTCASFLACNRQINEEMTQMMGRGQKAGRLAARVDCAVKDDAHYFTVVAVPFVKLAKESPPEHRQAKDEETWARKIFGDWIGSLFDIGLEEMKRMAVNKLFWTRINPTYSTVERLWMDIRPLERTGANIAGSQTTYNEMTCWAICAALKHMFDNGPDAMHSHHRISSVDEVILNVVAHTHDAWARSQGDGSAEDTIIVSQNEQRAAELLRNELVDVWDKIWSATGRNRSDLKARLYRTLLERIKRVRICVNGETFRTRGLSVELERGRAEMRRYQMR